MPTNQAYVDRVEASKILKVSTRTVDRYMRKYKFKTKKDGRLVLIKKKDIDKIVSDNINKFIDIKEENLKEIIDNKNADTSEHNFKVKDIKIKSLKDGGKEERAENQIYKELYIEVKKELKAKQERLEAATYRVGQLESQAKNMVPLLEFNKKDKALKEAYDAMDLRARQIEETKNKMEAKLKSERVAKWIYLSLVGFLLVAEPILFLLWAFV